jgi:phosphatidylglycerophosphatase A
MKAFRRPSSLADFTATLGGLGDASFAPGTWGSLVACAALAPLRENRPLYVAGLAVLGVAAVWSAGLVARRMKTADPGRIIIDEAFGMGLVLLAPLPAGWPGLATAFGLFRLFDILKPPPLRALERLPGGWGIVADDVGAAGYSALVLYLIYRAG